MYGNPLDDRDWDNIPEADPEPPRWDMNDDTFIVACTDEGVYCLATRRVFATRAEAEAYAATCSQSRTPVVVAGRWHQLRLPEGGF